jgi:4-hydroxy-2-oxoheptanedioate aldolase
MSATVYAALAKKLGGGSGLLTGWVSMPDPLLAGVVAREDLDAVTLDMQHGMVTTASAVLGIGQVALAGKPAIVRIPVGDFATASRMLDAGASGIIAPMINTVEDARQLAAYTKYPPTGERSWGPAIALGMTGFSLPEYLKLANGMTVTLAMVETRESLAVLESILAVDGIDGVFVGPSDLSIALTDGAEINALSSGVSEALDHVLARCRTYGKAACAFATTADSAKDLRKRGYDLIALGNDQIQLRAGIRSMLGIAKG